MKNNLFFAFESKILALKNYFVDVSDRIFSVERFNIFYKNRKYCSIEFRPIKMTKYLNGSLRYNTESFHHFTSSAFSPRAVPIPQKS